MNPIEFKELQNQMIESVYAYERFLKKGNLLDVEFNYNFHDYIEKGYKLDQENILMQDIILKLNNKESLESIESYISEFKAKYNKVYVALKQKERNCKAVCENSKVMSSAVIDEFERVFKDYVSSYHPAIKVYITKNEADLFEQLKKCYYENNYNAFQMLLDLNKNLKKIDIPEEKYIEASQYYYSIMQQIKLDVDKRKNAYPYDKENVFNDEITIASEEAEFKVEMSKLLGINTSLHKDLVSAYGEDISL